MNRSPEFYSQTKMRLSLRLFIVTTTGDRPACFPTMYKDPGTAELTFQTCGDRNKVCLEK